jgi:prepilin-type N-terminal cleavage/methylation domain-containing protein
MRTGRGLRGFNGFTLVELLVVIGIIAVLIAILLPTLNKARQGAQKTVCLSNMRQLSQAIVMYANANKGWYPPVIGSLQATVNHQVWDNKNRGPNQYYGWYMLGNLYIRGFLGPVPKDPDKDPPAPKAFYCPAALYPNHNYPDAWGLPGTNVTERRIGYMYRLIGQTNSPYLTDDVVKDFAKWKMGYPKGMRALAADIVGQRGSSIHWPHQNPWGLNVAYNDGHGAFVSLTKADNDKCANLMANGGSPGPASNFMYLFFNGADNGDFTEQRTKWNALTPQ